MKTKKNYFHVLIILLIILSIIIGVYLSCLGYSDLSYFPDSKRICWIWSV